MADKVQNVRINFITGPTPELQRAEALLTKTQQSTDKLNQATQQFGNQSRAALNALIVEQKRLEEEIRNTRAQNFKTWPEFTKALASVSKQYADVNTKIKLVSKSLADQEKAAQRVAKEQERAAKAQAKAAQQAIAEQAKLNQALQQSSVATQSLSNNFGSLVNAVRLFITAGIVRELVDTSLSMSRLAGNTESVGMAFEKQIPNSTALLFELRRATQGTVTDFDLMQRTLQAANFGIDVQELPKLLEFAAVRAQQTGVSVDYLVNSIVTGIGRKSILILDNLGISANRLKEEFGGTSIRAASIADTTRVVSKIAGEELDKMGGSLETAATKVDQLNVSYQKLRETISRAFVEGNVPQVLKDFVDSFQVLIEARQRDISVTEVWNERQRQQTAIVSANEFINRRFTKNKEENIKVLEEEIQALTNQIGAYAKNRDVTNETILMLQYEVAARKENVFELNDEFLAIEDNIKLIKQGLAVKEEDALLDQETLKILQARLVALKEEKELQEEEIRSIKTLRDELETLQKLREEDTSIDNTAELDRLQRSILLKEDEILKVSDRIEWEKKWGQAQQVTAAIEKMRAEDLEELNKKIAEFANIDLSNLEQNATKVKAFFSAFGLEDTEGTVKALEDNIEFLRNILEPLEDVDFSGIEIEPEVAINPQITNESRVRFRIRLREILGSDMVDAFIAAQEELKVAAIDIISEQLMSIEQAQIASLENQLSALSEYYDEQQILAGDNERYKDELRLEEERKTNELRNRIAEKEKKARRFSIIIDTAAGIMRAFATLPTPAAIVQSLIIAAQGASQLAIVNRQPAKFAKGVIDLQGPGTTTSDSIPARLSRRESVMTADETIKAKGILTDIRAKRLDDRVMANLRKPKQSPVYVFNDERIISELREMRKNQPDIIEQYGTLYKVSGKGTALQKRIRAKRISG